MEDLKGFIRCERVRLGDDTLPTLTYRLYEGRVEERRSFSLCCLAPKEALLYESEAYLFDVTSDVEVAERLFAILCDGAVTPYALSEVVEEFLVGFDFTSL